MVQGGARLLAVLAAVTLTAWTLPAAAAENAPSGPLVFQVPHEHGEFVYDFGIADQNHEYEADVTFRNTGSQTLEHLRARSGCSCYGATLSTETLSPGAAGTVHVKFRTYGFQGRVSKVLTLEFDGGKAKLRLRLDVVGGVLVRRLYFGEVLAGTQPEGSTTVGWYEGVGKPFKILGVTVPNLPLAARIEPWVVKERILPVPKDPSAPKKKVTYRGYRLHFHFTKPPPKGVLSAKAVVTTDLAENRRVLVPLTANVVGKVWLQTSRVYLGLVPRGTSRTVSVLFRGFDASIHLGHLSARDRKGLLKVEIRDGAGPTGPHKLLAVTVPTDAPVGPIEDVIELHTEVPGEEVVEIRVLGRVYKPQGGR